MKYLVALQTGGIMEMPDIKYREFEVIEATTEVVASEIYNKKHNCDYFYGVTLGKIEGGTITLSKAFFEHSEIYYILKEYSKGEPFDIKAKL